MPKLLYAALVALLFGAPEAFAVPSAIKWSGAFLIITPVANESSGIIGDSLMLLLIGMFLVVGLPLLRRLIKT